MRGNVIFVLLIALTVGCASNEDWEAHNKLENIHAAISNYEGLYDSFPNSNTNVWRFADATRFKSVSWRGALLDHLASVGYSRNPIELEKEIEGLGKANFFIGEKLIHSNFERTEGNSLRTLPEYFVVAFTVSARRKLDWNEPENESIDDILLGKADLSITRPTCYLLFANGKVGKFSGSLHSAPESLFEVRKAAAIDDSKLHNLGIQVLRFSQSELREAHGMPR